MDNEKLNFFQRLEQTNCKTIHLTVVFNQDNATLSIIPKSSVNDDSISELKPIILNAKTAEFTNDNIFKIIEEPFKTLATDFSNLKQYNAQKQEADNKSKIQKDLKDKYTKSKIELEKYTKQGKDEFPKNDKKIKTLIKEIKEYKPNCSSIKLAETLIAECSQDSLF